LSKTGRHVVFIGETGNANGANYLEDLGIGRVLLLKWIIKSFM